MIYIYKKVITIGHANQLYDTEFVFYGQYASYMIRVI